MSNFIKLVEQLKEKGITSSDFLEDGSLKIDSMTSEEIDKLLGWAASGSGYTAGFFFRTDDINDLPFTVGGKLYYVNRIYGTLNTAIGSPEYLHLDAVSNGQNYSFVFSKFDFSIKKHLLLAMSGFSDETIKQISDYTNRICNRINAKDVLNSSMEKIRKRLKELHLYGNIDLLVNTVLNHIEVIAETDDPVERAFHKKKATEKLCEIVRIADRVELEDVCGKTARFVWDRIDNWFEW